MKLLKLAASLRPGLDTLRGLAKKLDKRITGVL